MSTSNWYKINDFVKNLAHNCDLETDTPKLALSNTAPSDETNDPTADGNGVLGNVTEIDYTDYTDDNNGDRTLSVFSSDQVGGVYSYILEDLIVSAVSGGELGPFRYIYFFDDTVSSPNKPLITYLDKEESITLYDGDELVVDLNNKTSLWL